MLLLFTLLALTLGQADTPAVEAEESAAPSSSAPQPRGAVDPSLIIPPGGNIAVIPISGMIYDFTLDTLTRRVDKAVAAGASVIVIELDTPGGVLTSALEISKYLKTLSVPTIAWINNDAYSAGALIASACDLIVMAPASATGDAAPISMFGTLPPTERAKALSPLLEEFRDNARQHGYDYTLFHAMCVLGVEVYQVENTETGERRLVNQLDYRVLVGNEDPLQVDGPPSASSSGGVQFSTGSGGVVDPAAAMEVGAVALELGTAEQQGKWKLVSKVHDGTTLLTLNQTRAQEVGLAKTLIRDDAELVKYLSAAGIMTIGQHPAEQVAYFLTHPLARGILLLVFLVCAYLEFQAPGLGLFGALALLALSALLIAPFLVGLAQAWHLLVVLLGIGLIVLEVTYLPGFGLVGIAGVVLMLLGLALSSVPSDQTFGPAGGLPAPGMWAQAALSLLSLVIALAASFVAFFFITRHFGSLPLFGRMVLAAPATLPAGVEPVSGEDAIGAGAIEVGDEGRAATELRPAGRAEFDGSLVDVVSVGGFIDPGTTVRVVEVRGNRIVVDAA